MMHALQKFGGKKRKSAAAGLPIRFDKAGELITTKGHLSSALTVHFAEIEKGILLSWDELRARYNNEQLDMLEHASFNTEMLQTHRELLYTIKTSCAKKAVGPDGVSFDLLKAAAQESTDLILPLITKVGVSGREPLGFKGGWQ
eukprot:5499214-Pyramimonas_sp.AAC.1